MSAFLLRSADAADIDQILDIEVASIPDPWSEDSFVSFWNNPVSYSLVIESEGEICAFLTALVFESGECELLTVATKEKFRRMHLANKLLSELFDYALKKKCTEIFLEVRASNLSALALYENNGFVSFGERKNYYRCPRENAVLMKKELNKQ